MFLKVAKIFPLKQGQLWWNHVEDHNSPWCQHGPVDVGHGLCAGLYVIIVVQDIFLIIQELLVGSSVKARLSLFTNINPLLLPPGERWAFMLHWFSKYETYLPEVVEVGHHVVVERLAGQHHLCLRHHLLEGWGDWWGQAWAWENATWRTKARTKKMRLREVGPPPIVVAATLRWGKCEKGNLGFIVDRLVASTDARGSSILLRGRRKVFRGGAGNKILGAVRGNCQILPGWGIFKQGKKTANQ